MKLILVVTLMFMLSNNCYGEDLEYSKVEFDLGFSYNYYPKLDNITEDIEGENAYLRQDKFGLTGISAETNSFSRLEYGLGYNAQLKYWWLNVIALGLELQHLNLQSNYLAEANDENDSYYLQRYQLSSSALLMMFNLRPLGRRPQNLVEESFWRSVILDFNFGAGVYYNKFSRGIDMDYQHRDYRYVYSQEDEYDAVVPGFKTGFELTYPINQESFLNLGFDYNKIFSEVLTNEAGLGYRSIYSDDFKEEEFDLSNYGIYFNLIFNL